jgi:hypothetical protein
MMTVAQWEAQQRAAQQAQKPPAPAQPRAWEVRLDMIEGLTAAQEARANDPRIVAWHASELRRITAARAKLAEQFAELQRQDQLLRAEQAKHLTDSPFR